MAKTNPLPGARKEYRAQMSSLRLKDDELPAILGDGQGNCRIDQTHSWARVEGRGVMQVWNDRVPHIDDWEVIVGYEAGENLFRVLRPRDPYHERPYALFGEHGAAHSMFHPDGGHDIAWIDIRQWMPWRVFPSSTFTVSVWYGIQFRNGGWHLTEIQSLDLSSYQPASGALFVLITFDEDGTLSANAGTGVADKDSLTEDDIPAPPVGHVPLAAVRLWDLQTEIVEQRDDTDIIDLRYPPYTTMAPASATGGIIWQDVYIVAKSGAPYTTISGGYGPAVGTSTPSTVLVAPGIYAESVPLQSGTKAAIVAMDHRHLVQITPPASSPINISDAANDVHIIDGLRLNPLSGQASISVPSTGFGTFVARNCYIGANSGPSVSTTAAAATMDFTLEHCYAAGDLNIKALTRIIDCNIAGSITQSAGAGNLTIDGGNIDGDLTHVAGSTITLRNLPRIAGTVSGAGTLVGPYVDSGGNIVGGLSGFGGFANPTGLIGMAAVNGVATTATRSDATHAIDPAIAPTWTGLHTFNTGLDVGVNTFVDALTDGNTGGFRAGALADVLWYRDTIERWRTPDNVQIDGGLTVGAVTAASAGEIRAQGFRTTVNYLAEVDGSGGGYLAGTSSDVQLYRNALNMWRTPDGLTVDLGLNIGSASSAATGEARASVGFAARVDGSGGGFYAGAASDVQLFRGAADTWYTDSGDSFYIGATAGIGTAPSATIGLNIVNGTRALTGQVSDAGTTNIVQAISIYHVTSGTPAANFGVYWDTILTTTSGNAVASAFYTQWVDATLATRKAVTRLYVYDTAARLYLTGEASGTAAMIGFLGAAAAIRQTGGAATAGATYTATEQGMLQKAYDALRTFGLLT